MRCFAFLLLAAVVGVCTGPSAAADKENLKENQDKALAKIKELGGTAVLDEKATSQMKPIMKVSLSNTPAKNPDLAVLKTLITIEELNLNNTKITNSGLANIQKLINLRLLNLTSCGINDNGMSYLKNLEKLEYLNLEDTEVTDKCFDNFKKMRLLKTLNSRRSKVTDKGIQYIQKTLPEVNVLK